MTGVPADEKSEGALGLLLLPLRIPLRALAGLADVAGTIDRRAAQLVQAVGALQEPLDSIDGKVSSLERSLNERLLEVRGEVADIQQRLDAMMPQLERMAGELEDTTKLLPDPNDGPLARLRDTFSSS